MKSQNLRVIVVTSFLTGLCSSMTQAVWQPFVLSLGAPMSTLGLLESLGGRRGLTTALIQPIGGLLYDRFGFQAPILANLVGVAIALVAIIVAVKEPSGE